MNNNELNNNVTGQMPTPASLDVVAPVEAPGTNVVPPTVSQPVEMPGMQQPAPKKNSKKMLLIILSAVLFITIIGAVLYFVVFAKDKKDEKKDPEKQEESKKPGKEEKEDWDPKTSIIKEAESDTKLVCVSEEAPYSGMINKITYTYLYKDNMSVQVIIEDEMMFNDDSMKYYDYYVGSGLEEVEYQKAEYDNITIEVRQKSSSVSLAYAYDFTADPSNPKNMMSDKDLDIISMQTKMQNLGFECK